MQVKEQTDAEDEGADVATEPHVNFPLDRLFHVEQAQESGAIQETRRLGGCGRYE